MDKRKERVMNHEMNKSKKPNLNPDSKIYNDSARLLDDNFYLLTHGKGVEKKIGRPLKFATDEIMRKEIKEYVEHCGESNTIPSVLGLSLWLGVHRDTIYEWSNGDFPYTDTIKLAMQMIHKYTEDNALLGNINPVLYFFMSKNYWGMRDTTETVIRPATDKISEKEQLDIINAIPPTE